MKAKVTNTKTSIQYPCLMQGKGTGNVYYFLNENEYINLSLTSDKVESIVLSSNYHVFEGTITLNN